MKIETKHNIMTANHNVHFRLQPVSQVFIVQAITPVLQLHWIVWAGSMHGWRFMTRVSVTQGVSHFILFKNFVEMCDELQGASPSKLEQDSCWWIAGK